MDWLGNASLVVLRQSSTVGSSGVDGPQGCYVGVTVPDIQTEGVALKVSMHPEKQLGGQGSSSFKCIWK